MAPLALPLAAVMGVGAGARLAGVVHGVAVGRGGATTAVVTLVVAAVVTLVVAAVVALVVAVVVRARRRVRGVSAHLAAVAGPTGVLAVVVVLAALSGARSWLEYHSVVDAPYTGAARVMSDPDDRGGAVQVVLEVEGERFEVWARGSPARRLRRTLMGDMVEVTGERIVPDDRPWWWRSRHVVGRLDVDRVGSVRAGAPVFEAANRVRRQLEHGARTMSIADRALFTGFVMGDDRALPDDTVVQFRSAGLSHLTAVSGQNVALLLAIASPLLRRLSPWWRWCVTLALIGWFALLTRFEPSVLRASAMAAVAATAFVTGRERSGVGVLSVALTGLVLVDPMLVWSVGFWLSAAATAGLAWAASPLTEIMRGPRWLRTALGATIAAQLGVMPVAAAVFGVPSVIGLVANLMAVPVAGLVMVTGFPCALVASVLPDPAARVVMAPCGLAVRWVAGVARAMAGMAPSGAVDVALWLVVGALVARGLWRRRRQGAGSGAVPTDRV